MRIPWFDALRVVAAVVGGCFLWQSARERARLEPEYERLTLLTGELNPADPTKIYVRAIPMEEPLEYAWRVYFPPNYRIQVRHTSGSSFSGTWPSAVDAIVRVRLREIDGRWLVYHRFPFSSGLMSLRPQVAQTLREHPERILVEQLGHDSLAAARFSPWTHTAALRPDSHGG